jgi:hypothetical protein
MLSIRYKNLLDFEVADDPSKQIFFVFGVRKSGSSILNNIVHAIANMNGVNYVDVAGRLFHSGINVPVWQRDPELRVLLRPGNIYGGFRNFPIGLAGDEQLLKSKKVLMVRDPRDALVSEYYSNAYSHSVPDEGQARKDMLAQREEALRSAIEAYVLKMAPLLKRTLVEYRMVESGPAFKLLRYEDFITEKRALLAELCRFYSWTISEQQTNQILGWADIIPDTERPTEFIRKVIPGDHIRKLSLETIKRLNEIFADELAFYGYP